MLGVYIHWPYCLKKCPYCAFNSHLQEEVNESQWKLAFTKELENMYKLTSNQRVQSIFFGGGTPSLMPPSLIEHIIQTIRNFWETPPFLEISLEANPMTYSKGLFQKIKNSGVNRISLGVQSFNQEHLKFLGRQHSREIAIQSIRLAKSVFQNVSFDLIYGLPNQTLAQWQNNLEEAIFLQPSHLSLYQLTIEPQTPFAQQVARKKWQPINQDIAGRFLKFTWAHMLKNNFNNYEISNFAKEGFECVHNKIYWNYQDFIGIGPGAHGRFEYKNKKYSTVSFRAPQTWLNKALSINTAIQTIEPLTPTQSGYEYLSMSLRLKKGSSLSRLTHLAQKPLDKILHLNQIHTLENEGFLHISQETISLTEKGRFFVDHICSKILI